MGAALANLSTGLAAVTATIFDADGTLLTVQQLSLPPSGHTAFLVPDRFVQTAGRRSLIQFQSSGGLAGLGLRASPTFALSSVPTILP